jgi:hypothetical protein
MAYANKPRTQVLGSKLKSTEVDYRRLLISPLIPNQEMATPFLDLKNLTGFQFTKV